MLVLHRCDTPACVNPSHLFLGTPSDNMRDMVRKGRNANNNGHRSPKSKLSYDAVRDVRNSPMSVSGLAFKYKVSRRAISLAKAGVTWK